MQIGWSRLMVCASCALSGVFAAAPMQAQQLPDAPSTVAQGGSSLLPGSNGGYSSSDDGSGGQAAQAPAPQQANGEGVQTKRILGIIPNFRSVSADTKLRPLTVKQKFVEASQDSFDYSAVVLPAVVSAISYESNSTPEFGTGGVGYARYFWHAAVDQTIENYLVEFIVPVASREDPRYYTKGRGGFLKRTGYSLSRAVITRTDNDKETFNFSEVIGAGAAAGISNLYYPRPERTFGNTGTKWATNVGIDAFTFVAKEFWPDINRALFHGKE